MTPIRLLLIEDDVIDQRAFVRALRDTRWDSECTAVFSLTEAREALKTRAYDLIISDYRLGDGVALDLLTVVDGIPMIIVTGVGDEEIAVRALKAGVSDYLVKDHEHRYLKVLPVTVETVLRRQKLETDEREQRSLASALRDTALALTSTLELTEVLQRILLNVRKVVPHDRANIMLIEGERVRIVQSSEGYPLHLDTVCCSLDAAEHFQQMFATQKPYLVGDVAEAAVDIYFPGIDNPASYLAAPLIASDEVIGFINLDSQTKNHFVPFYAERLQAFAAQATVALENARLYHQSAELAALQERQQIARDLHDSVTQTLFSASVMTESVITLYEQDPAQVGQELTDLHALVRGALAEMRTLLFELRPDVLANANIHDLLQQLIDTFRGRTRIDIVFAAPPRDASLMLTAAVKIALYRITQEALNNVVKHARAKAVQVEFLTGREEVLLRVVDDGRGFDTSKSFPGRFGLKMMQERAQTAGVQCCVSSTPGHGTEVLVCWQTDDVGNG